MPENPKLYRESWCVRVRGGLFVIAFLGDGIMLSLVGKLGEGFLNDGLMLYGSIDFFGDRKVSLWVFDIFEGLYRVLLNVLSVG